MGRTGGGKTIHGHNMVLNSEKLVIYFGTFNTPKTLSQVAEELYGEKKDSVRSAFSRKKALDEMLDEEYLLAKKDGNWKYQANEEKLEQVLCHLLEHEDKDMPEINVRNEDLETIQETFRNDDVVKYFENDKVSNVLGEKVSLAEKQLSTYVKMLYVALAGSRIIIEDMNISQDKQVTLTDEGLERLEGTVKLLNFASKESPLRIGAIFEEMMKGSEDIDIMQLPRTENPTVKTLAEQTKKFMQEFLGLEVETIVNVGEPTAAAS